jgi:hypothetical protein
MQTRSSLHLYLIALIVAAIVIPFALSRSVQAQVDPAAVTETNARNLLLPARQDTSIAQSLPNRNFGTEPNLIVGRQGVDLVAESAALLQWDLSAFPVGTQLGSAEIGLFQTISGTGPVLIYQVFAPWDAQAVTWATQPGAEIYDRTWIPSPQTGQYEWHDVSKLVDQWVNSFGNPPNYGVLLRNNDVGTAAAHTFASREAPDRNPPLLRINYTLPPIRVCVDQAEPCQPAVGAQVFDKTTGQLLGVDASGLITPTVVGVGDELWARLPVKDPYPQSQLFYTTDGLAAATAEQFQLYGDLREMRLVVRSDKPLLLYNLDMTAQWYLDDDPAFRQALERNIVRASEYLYDFTDGQFALGRVTVRQSYEGWDDADIKLHTSNVLHPNATIGGIVLTDTADIAPTVDITYTPGSIFMGSYWNRFGTPPNQEVKYNGVVVTQDEMNDDWSIALAHEMGHYLLFLFDTYTDKNGVSSDALAALCTGTAMGNAYAPSNQAFIFDQAAWDSACGETEAHFRLHGRTEWATIAGWYNFAVVPTEVALGGYPPVPLTNVVFVSPAVAPPPLASQVYTLTYQLNETSSGEARAFLLRDDSLIFEQGKPAKGTTTVDLTDARVGDRLCVYDLNDHAEQPELPRHQFGCKTVVAGDSQLPMTQDASWNPVVTILQTGPQQLSVTVKQALANGLALQGRLIPETDTAGPVQSLARSGDTWSTIFNLSAPVEPVYLQLWVEEAPSAPHTRREVIADRGTGGNGAYGPARHYGGVLAISSDGNASYASDDPLDLKPGESVAWQSMPGTPPVPPWKKVSGQSYRLDAFPSSLVSGGTVTIQYEDGFGVLRSAGAPSAGDAGVQIHFWDGSQWRPLPTTIAKPAGADGGLVEDGIFAASAPSQGVGIYAVMAENKPNLFMPILRR